MSFIKNKTAKLYAPGYFLAKNEDCVRITFEAAANNAQVVTDANGGKYVPMGTVWPANGNTAVGIVYEDVDVSEGNAPGSLVVGGVVYENRLPDTLDSDAKTALIAKGFTFLQEGSVTRPTYDAELDEITVQSAAGTNNGTTKLTLSGYTPGTGESYVYKMHATTAPTIAYGQTPDYTWTAWNGSADIAATTGHKVTVVSIDAHGEAVAYGTATITAK